MKGEEEESKGNDAKVEEKKSKKDKKKKDKKKGEGSESEGDTSAEEGGGKKKKKKKNKKDKDKIEEEDGEEEKAKGEEPELEPEPEPEPDKVDILIRPIDHEWIMGSDLRLTMLLDEPVRMMRERIQEAKPHISPHRMVLIDALKQVVSGNRENNTFRRLALKENTVYILEPTIKGSWLWMEREWYEEKVISDIFALVDRTHAGQITVEEAESKIIVPPFIKTSLRVFLRRFPDKIHMVVDTDKCHYWVRRPPSTEKILYQLPTFANFPVNMGHVHHHKPDPFDWDAHADINDTKRVELDFDIPDIKYEISILSAANIKRADVFGSSDPQCIVTFFNGKEEAEIGRTVTKRNTLFPEWRDERFELAINASIEVEYCRLLIDMFDCDIGPNGKDIPGDFLGAVELTGLDIVYLIADGKTHEVEYTIKPRKESAPLDPQEDITGTLLLKGGKAGYEVKLVACRQLVDTPNLTSHVFGIIIFNEDEICETLINTDRKDPVFMENVNVPFSEMSTKLEDCLLEFQIWGTMGKGEGVDPDAKGKFLGSLAFTGDELVHFLKGSNPYATSIRGALKSSKNVPLNQRKNNIEGYITVIGGPAGLPMRPGKKYEIQVLSADRVSKVINCYVEVEWNFVKTWNSDPTRVELGKSRFNKTLKLETDGGATNVLNSSLRLDLWEDVSQAFGVVEQNYMGMVFLDKEDLSQLMDGKYAKEMTFDWQTDDSKPAKIQRLVRGNVTLRGGALGNRLEDERCFYIYQAKNLGRANTGAMLGVGSSDPFVEVTLNGEVLHTTPVVEANLNPVWAEQLIYVRFPEPRELDEKELKKWLRENDKRAEEGLPPRERTIFSDTALQIAVYDETNDGGKGACLGVVRMEEEAIKAFFDTKEPHETWYPLTKDGRKENTDSATRNPTLGKDSEIKLGTPGKKYPSPIMWRMDVEAAIQAEQERLRAEEEERIAIELQKLEAERKKQEDAERREKEREDALAAEKKAAEEAAVAALTAKAEEQAAEAADVDAAKAEEEAKAKAEEEAKRAADQEAYDEMMELADD